MRKHTIIIMCMALVLLTGCGGRPAGWQTGNVTLVRTVGIDSLPEGGVRLSAFADTPLTAEGASVAQSMQALRSGGESFLHFGHTDQLLLGEAFVQRGVEALLDYVARDGQIGPAAKLWVLRGDTAEQAASACEDVSARLVRLAEDDGGAAPKLACSATRLMSVLAREGSVAVPALTLVREELAPDGYAVLRRGRLVGFLEGKQALGLELLQRQGKGQLVELQLPDEIQVTLQVERGAVRCEPIITQDGVGGLRLRCAAQLSAAQGPALTRKQQVAAVRQAELVLCGRMAAALACAQLWDADFMQLEQLAWASCSAQEWAELGWDENFRALPLQVWAEARVDWPADMMEE